jgi:signal peptidase II
MRTLTVAVLVLAIDQLLKSLAVAGWLAGPWIEPATNPDVALGLAAISGNLELLVGVLALGLAWTWARTRLHGRAGEIAVGLVLGGSVGNLVDRALHGAVIDFVTGPGILFNPADVALLAGVAIALVAARQRKVIGTSPVTAEPSAGSR